MKKELPAALTSYDFLKCAALLLMVIDHTGAFLLPDQEWMRVVGRLSAPIWLFLIGYARSRDLSWKLWAGTALIALGNVALGEPLLPLCILFTIILCRLSIDPLMHGIVRGPTALYPALGLLFALDFVTVPLFEYGTSALMFVMIGYMARNRGDLPLNQSQFLQFTVIAAGLYALLQILLFMTFTTPEKLVTGVGILTLALALTRFHPQIYESLSAKLPRPLVWLGQVGGRYTLEIYVLHFLAFKAIGLAANAEGQGFFGFHIFQ